MKPFLSDMSNTLYPAYFFKQSIAKHNFQSYAADIDDLNNKIQNGTILMEEIKKEFEATLNMLEKLIEENLKNYVKSADSNDLEKLKEAGAYAYDQIRRSCIQEVFYKINFLLDIEEINILLSQNSITYRKSTLSLTDLLSSFACKIRFIEFIIHALHARNGVKTITNIKDSCYDLSNINLGNFIRHRFAKSNKLHVKAEFVLPKKSGLFEQAAEKNLDKEIIEFAKNKVSDAKGGQHRMRF